MNTQYLPPAPAPQASATPNVVHGPRYVTGTCDTPKRFVGTPEERLANRNTHWFFYPWHDEPGECDRCCCKDGSLTSDWPCGVCPRELVVKFSDGSREVYPSSRIVFIDDIPQAVAA